MAHVGLDRVRRRIADACAVAGRPASDVDLLVVSKQRSAAEVLAVHRAGQRRFAENRQQALVGRSAEDLPSDIEWHFVGPVQSRKARSIADHCVLLHSLGRMKVARIWADHRPSVPVLAEFNLADEPQKDGFDPRDADRVLDTLVDLGLRVRGTMAIPPNTEEVEDRRPWFAMLRSIHDRWSERADGIEICSMGMSADLELAIEEGATMVRVGRAIFEHGPHRTNDGGNDQRDG